MLYRHWQPQFSAFEVGLDISVIHVWIHRTRASIGIVRTGSGSGSRINTGGMMLVWCLVIIR